MWGKFVHLSITFTISPTISPQYPPAEPAVAKNIPKLAKEVVVDRAMTIRRVSSAEIQSQYFPPKSAPTFPARLAFNLLRAALELPLPMSMHIALEV